jgi:5-methylcytosine-specific restriction protein A
MTKRSDLKPKKKEKVCVLLERAGIKVERNQYFLSEWAHVEPRKVAVLNFWFAQMKQRGQDIVFDKNFRAFSDAREKRNKARVKQAISEKLPFRIIILDGKMGSPKGSIVSKRQLDSAIWRVTAVDQKTGDYTLTRGAEIENAIDDLSAPPEGNQFPDRASVVVQVIKRDNRVRAHAIKRAKGKCEYCNVRGFPTTNGRFYVEAHHIIALCDSGKDTVDNVIALCPQHHRQAHYGKDAESLELEFIKILEKLNKKS